MRAITIRQPYAKLIVDGLLPAKNSRTGMTYPRQVAIHASGFRDIGDSADPALEYEFGAVIGIAQSLSAVSYRMAVRHKHYKHFEDDYRVFGPYCLIFHNVRAIEPIKARGSVDLWSWKIDTKDIVYLETPTTD